MKAKATEHFRCTHKAGSAWGQPSVGSRSSSISTVRDICLLPASSCRFFAVFHTGPESGNETLPLESTALFWSSQLGRERRGEVYSPLWRKKWKSGVHLFIHSWFKRQVLPNWPHSASPWLQVHGGLKDDWTSILSSKTSNTEETGATLAFL